MKNYDTSELLVRLGKDIIKAEFDFNEMTLAECRHQIAKKEYLFKRLFFLKKFGFPLGCIVDAFNPWRSVVRDSCTSDGCKTDYSYNGVRFMDKIIKLTKNGWQVEFIYRQ